MGTANSTTIMQNIDYDIQHNIDIWEHVEELIKFYDKNKSGNLTGFEIAAFIDDLSRYIYDKKIKNKYNDITFSCVRSWIYTTLDDNCDGTLSKDELYRKLKVVFNKAQAPLKDI